MISQRWQSGQRRTRTATFALIEEVRTSVTQDVDYRGMRSMLGIEQTGNTMVLLPDKDIHKGVNGVTFLYTQELLFQFYIRFEVFKAVTMKNAVF
jgi:hypothetical protein